MKPIKNTRRTRFSNEAATRLHAEANKSDPFASRRMALHLANGYTTANTKGESHGVADESLHIIRGRDAQIATAVTAFKKLGYPTQCFFDKTEFTAPKSDRAVKRAAFRNRVELEPVFDDGGPYNEPPLSMSMFATRADYDAAVAA